MMKIHAIAPADLELLKKYDTPTICNVVELFDRGSRTAFYMDRRIHPCFPKLPPMVGYAATATFRSAFPPTSGNVYSGLDQQIAAFAELPGPPVVVFQDLDTPVMAATFGEIMCTTYKSFGAAGLITSGAARDLDQVEAICFPCFADGVICAHGYCHILQVGVPVHVGGVQVTPGLILHGDRNGVTTIANEIASEVAHACAEYMAAEQLVLDYLKTPNINPKGYGEARMECKNRIDALAKRLKGK
jgi:regulator of RNase E activity RraA